ncbi:enolase-like domain-containing protein [Sabulicella rubraurantiaca]|uniref:mandelate racemase n=1 Tax=Sabulicella rubraurantiaca TaxID=2811429 RepID=UPI001A95DF16|nr:mandelate racemase [Sabulicella rubraurantiaca]
MKFRFLGLNAFEWNFTLRMPFRFGVITVRDGIQCVVRARIRTEDGRESEGMAAETLAAKWFDKNPGLNDADNQHQLRRTVEIAMTEALAAPAHTAFGHFVASYLPHVVACGAEGLDPLVASFGRALVDRAAFDALLRLEGLAFHEGLRADLGGFEPARLAPELAGFDARAMLAATPAPSRIHARHTVGLLDPITNADLAERVDDGLPETLEQVAGTYRHVWWKLKVGGDIHADVDRLCRIASVLDRLDRYHVTLDGNEQYEDVAGSLALWRAMQAEPRLSRLCASVALIEQPVKRARALEKGMDALAAERPVIIDESDGPLDAFVVARGLGYSGVSTKACKGFWRSLINLARCRAWNADLGHARYFLSAEDLTTLAGLCVQQDLALVSALGLPHVERNGHHFIAGFAGQPKADAARFLAAHADLYSDTPRGPHLSIRAGEIDIGSLAAPGFGSAVLPDVSTMRPMAKAAWPVSSQ